MTVPGTGNAAGIGQEGAPAMMSTVVEELPATAALALAAQQQQQAYQPVAFNGTLPGAPQGSTVAAAFTAIDLVQQGRTNADNFFTFFMDPMRNLLLNGDKTLYAALMMVGAKVKLIFGLTFGTAPI